MLSEVPFKRLPDDAVAYIALTASDLWPGAENDIDREAEFYQKSLSAIHQ